MIEHIHLFFPLVSIYINSFFMDIRFEFHKSNQQKVGPFCFPNIRHASCTLSFVAHACRVSMWREDNGIGGWYYHIRHNEKMECGSGRGIQQMWLVLPHQECGSTWSTVEKHNGHTGHSRGFCHHTSQIVYIYILNKK